MTDGEPDAVGLLACLDELRGFAARTCAEMADDPAQQADFAVKLFGVLMAGYLQQLSAEASQPVFLPSVSYFQMYGTPSPDTLYRTARVDGGGEYRITGVRGSVADVSVMPFGAPGAAGMRTFAPFTFDDLVVDADGTFEVSLAHERPRGAKNWWRLDPDMRTLMLRSVSRSWGSETEPRLAIVRLDGDPRRSRQSPERVSQGLAALAQSAVGMISYDRQRIAQLTRDGLVNRLADVDYSANGGLAQQWYQEGVFVLDEDQALLVEATLRPGCDSFCLALTDENFSTIDWMNAQSSLNNAQAHIDEDGVVRAVIAANDPGTVNWLDTTGHRAGALQFRWLGGESPPEVRLEVVSASTASAAVLAASTASSTSSGPLVTAADRASTVRARQVGAQLRGW